MRRSSGFRRWAVRASPSHAFLRCERALPAADFAAALVRPSRSTLEAAVATAADVTSVDFDCVRALPAADFEAAPALGFLRV